ncbi:MAG: ABC transporter substrate-binding protein [Geminicoccaceae bacterium]
MSTSACGATPRSSAASRRAQPWTVLNVGEGHLRFIVVTHPDSGIKSVQDLKGKTVGALLGGDPYNALSQILYGELGSGDPAANDISIVNTPTQAQAATVRPAWTPYRPSTQKAGTTRHRQASSALLFGYTRARLQRPRRRGRRPPPALGRAVAVLAGRLLPASLLLGRAELGARRPSGRRDGLHRGQQQAVEELSASPGGSRRSRPRYWNLRRDGSRGGQGRCSSSAAQVWPTEGDAGALLAISKFMVEGGLIEEPLTWDQVKNAMRPAGRPDGEGLGNDGKVPEGSLHRHRHAGPARPARLGDGQVAGA